MLQTAGLLTWCDLSSCRNSSHFGFINLNGSIAPLIPNVVTQPWCVVRLTPPVASPPEKTADTRWTEGWLGGQFWRRENLSPCRGSKLGTSSPWPSRYTDYSACTHVVKVRYVFDWLSTTLNVRQYWCTRSYFKTGSVWYKKCVLGISDKGQGTRTKQAMYLWRNIVASPCNLCSSGTALSVTCFLCW